MLYAVIIALWACVLLPMWLWRHDEIVKERRSADRFSRAMSTLSSRNRAGDHREVVMPAREPEPVAVDGRPLTIAGARGRLAARRRRSFVILVGLLVIVGGVTATGRIPLWSLAIPGVLVLGFLLHLRRQVGQQRALDRRRRQQATTLAHRRERSGGAAMSRGIDVETVLPVARQTAEAAYDDALAGEAIHEVAPAAAAGFYDALADPGSWEPTYVPLPTYVLAPKAPRSVRVIDLSLPGSWTSGHLDEDELAAMEAARVEDARLEAEAASHVRLERASGDGIVTGEVVIERRRAVGG